MSDALITLLVLAVMAVLFVINKPPIALTAMLGATALVLFGVITPEEMFAALSGDTIVLIAGMMVIGAGLFHSGVAEAFSNRVIKVTGTSEFGVLLATLIVATVLSAIASGVAVAAMLLPVVIGICQRANISVSKPMLPLAFAASFGSSLTLVGAASNVIVSGQIESLGHRPLTFFELGKVGVPIAIVGIVYLLTIGRKLLPDHGQDTSTFLESYTHRDKDEPQPVKATIAVVILFAVLIAMIVDSEALPMSFVAAVGAIIMILTGCLKENEAYRSVDWSVIFVIAGMSAVTAGMAESGAAEMIGNATSSVLGEEPNKYLVLVTIFSIVMILTNFMLNTSTALLLTPIFVPVAVSAGVDPIATAVAICIGASSPFLTPVGSGQNVLVVKPGQLRFMDFVRPGIGLTLVVSVTAMIFIPIFWPI